MPLLSHIEVALGLFEDVAVTFWMCVRVFCWRGRGRSGEQSFTFHMRDFLYIEFPIDRSIGRCVLFLMLPLHTYAVNVAIHDAS